jgi:hypothetical protein
MKNFEVNWDITNACSKFDQAFQILLLIRKCSNVQMIDCLIFTP